MHANLKGTLPFRLSVLLGCLRVGAAARLLALQHFEVDYLFGQMEPGSGSGVAKVTHESKKHKIAAGSWIVKAKEKGTVVKNSIVFKVLVLDGKHEELAKMYAASLYVRRPAPRVVGVDGAG